MLNVLISASILVHFDINLQYVKCVEDKKGFKLSPSWSILLHRYLRYEHYQSCSRTYSLRPGLYNKPTTGKTVERHDSWKHQDLGTRQSTSDVFVHLFVHTTQHRLCGLGHQAAPLLYSLLLPPAFWPMGLERQQPRQEVEKRETASILSS
jgi:hypothetical protein